MTPYGDKPPSRLDLNTNTQPLEQKLRRFAGQKDDGHLLELTLDFTAKAVQTEALDYEALLDKNTTGTHT